MFQMITHVQVGR
uniref:Uncharacterized protein n=1 Tax=Anguilla anguilla TaxID=7936 RepID=A0A0E9PML3_ANGAN